MPIKVQKDMNTYLWFAYRFCIIAENKHLYEQWCNMHFMSLITYSYKDGVSLKLDYEEYLSENECFNDIFYIRNIKFDEMLSLDVEQFIIECIMSEKYIELELDEYYLPSSREYNKKHFVHPIFIFGYSSEGIVYYMGISNRHVLELFEEKISVVSNALKQGVFLNMANPMLSLVSCCRIISYKKEINNKYSVEETKRTLECLIYSKHNTGIINKKTESMIFSNDKILYGYDAIESLIKCLQRGYNNDCDIDYRAFHLLAERAHFLKSKLLYAFQSVGKDFLFYEDYCKLYNQYEILRLRFLKDSVKNRDFLKQQMKRDFYSDGLGKILSHEKKIVSKSLEAIQL